MSFPLLDRIAEMSRVRASISNVTHSFIVIYGRRRCGKSRLLQETLRPGDIYFLADTRDTHIQISSLAQEISAKIPGFADVTYPSWDSLVSALERHAPRGIAVVLDEFPHLVRNDPSLPSVLQRYVDRKPSYHLAICGSSQRMMHGLVLDSKAPLYGRANEILRITPLLPGWIVDALRVTGRDAVEAYAVWGGVPRYWEAAAGYPTLDAAVKGLVLDRNGVFHEESQRLLNDDLRSSAQPHSLLSLIAAGCHRLSEIAGRLGRPAGSLSGPLAALIDLGYVTREVPFGESLSSTKRTLYRLQDPFLEFWYRFVPPNRSMLELGRIDEVYEKCQRDFAAHTAGIWEQLSRVSTAFLPIAGQRWEVGSRWWGADVQGVQREIDVVALSLDGESILLGEAKWERRPDLPRALMRLREAAAALPFTRDKKVSYALWVPEKTDARIDDCDCLDAQDVMRAVR